MVSSVIDQSIACKVRGIVGQVGKEIGTCCEGSAGDWNLWPVGLRPGCGSEGGPGKPSLDVCILKVSQGPAEVEILLSVPGSTQNCSMGGGPSINPALVLAQIQRPQHLPGMDLT